MREYEKHITRLKRNIQEQLMQFWMLCNKENIQEAGLDKNDSSMEFLFTENATFNLLFSDRKPTRINKVMVINR